MIDIATESLLTLRDAVKQLPPRPNGKRVHISAIYRWASRGIRGVQLEVIRVGGTTYTSVEALQRFADRLSSQVEPVRSSDQPTTHTRTKQIETAERRLKEILGR